MRAFLLIGLIAAGGGLAAWQPAMADSTERVSVDSAGNEATGGDSSIAFVSANGRFVAFSSLASNLVAGDSNGSSDAFVRDRLTGVTERVSVDSAGKRGGRVQQRRRNKRQWAFRRVQLQSVKPGPRRREHGH